MRIGDWIQTFSGGKFWPLDPLPSEVLINDIAHALSMLCRFGGHTSDFYSVAQHSCLVADHCSQENKLWGLLHDASEAYLCDVPRPIKKGWREAGHLAYDAAENLCMKAICIRFLLPLEMPEEVKEMDDKILATEARSLVNLEVFMDSVGCWSADKPLDLTIEPWSHVRSKQEFMARFREYTK